MICAREPTARLVAAAALAAAMLVAAPGRADDNHYQNFIVGERAAGLGGAFTAISDDASGAFYNPAGLADAPYSSVSLSASIYGYAGQSYTADAVGFESANRTFITYPTTAAWIQRVRKGNADGGGRVQLALSLLTPRADVLRQRVMLSGVLEGTDGPQETAQRQLLIVEDDTLWVGLSAAWKIFRHLLVGISAFGTIRSGMYQLHNQLLTVQYDPTASFETNRQALVERLDIDLSHYGLVGVAGVLVPVTDRLRLGASFRAPSLELRGRAAFNYLGTVPDESTGAVELESVDIDSVTFRDSQPFKATLGGAYLVPRRFGASLDFSIYGPVGEYPVFEYDADPSLVAGIRMKKRLVWQLNVGGEYYIAGVVPVRLGFFTNLSSLASFDLCDASGTCQAHENIFTDGVNLFGFTSGVGYEMDRATLTLNFSYSLGIRETTTEGGITLTTERSFLLFGLGGSFRF